MFRSVRVIAGAVLASLILSSSIHAQDAGTVQVGDAKISVGGGTAILTLPDIPSFVSLAGVTVPSSFQTGTFKLSKGFDDEIGGNINGAIEVPVGGPVSMALGGFWSTIESSTNATCLDGDFNNLCMFAPLVDNPNTPQRSLTSAIGQTISTATEREVDHWGVSLEARWDGTPDISGVTRAPRRRHLALGAEIRGIDQKLDVEIVNTRPGFTPATYAEALETTYYGIYAAWGRDYSLPFFKRMFGAMGLQSSFLLRGGIYHAETDYDGSLADGTSALQQATSALSLSRSEVAFIGGIVLETTKRIGQRATLSLKSEYDYYSYVPDMAYNQVDASNTGVTAIGGQAGTVIGEDDAYSMRTSLRLTIGLGPRDLYGQ